VFARIIDNSLGEIKNIPWPPDSISAQVLAEVDLTNLGLNIGKVQDAKDVVGESLYIEGTYIEYHHNQTRIATITVLKYSDSSSASSDFSSFLTWAEATAPTRTTFHWLNRGFMHLTWNNGYTKILWNDKWIVEVLALEGTNMKSNALLDEIIKEISTYWGKFKAS
jgi:hypothetical protein